MMETKIPTPLTDANAFQAQFTFVLNGDVRGGKGEVVHAEHARKLEADRQALREALERIRDHFDMDGYGADAWKNLAHEMAAVARAALEATK